MYFVYSEHSILVEGSGKWLDRVADQRKAAGQNQEIVIYLNYQWLGTWIDIPSKERGLMFHWRRGWDHSPNFPVRKDLRQAQLRSLSAIDLKVVC